MRLNRDKMIWISFVCMSVCTRMVHAGSETDSLQCVVDQPQMCKKIHGGSFQLKSKSIKIDKDKDGTLKFFCGHWSALDYSSLPRFGVAVEVSKVEFFRCPPPTNKTYAEILAEINVTLQPEGSLILKLEKQPPLTAHHFTGLENLTELTLSHDRYEAELHVPSPGCLSPLHNLRALIVEKFEFPAVEQLPSSLLAVSLKYTKLRTLPESVRALPNLKMLEIESRGLEAFKSEQSGNENVIKLIPTLESLTYRGWSEEYPGKIVQCDTLRAFHFSSTSIEVLPERWLAACPRLEILHMDTLMNPTMPLKLLEGASILLHLSITNSDLETLPADLLHYVPKLRTLDLSGNSLHTLPSGIFRETSALHTIKLFYNNLGAEVQDELKNVHSLTDLDLSYNRELPDLCEPEGTSKLYLTNLKELDLFKTSVTHTCSDWRNITIVVDKGNERLQNSIKAQQLSN